jgi:hypothetical protein
MKDHFEFEAPLGFVGALVEKLILFDYMRQFLEVRNARLKVLAEGNEWQQYLHEPTGSL